MGKGESPLLLCNIVKIAQIRFAAEWIVLYRIPLCRADAEWLKLYYEKVGFVDIGFKNLMYANINQILANHRLLGDTPNSGGCQFTNSGTNDILH